MRHPSSLTQFSSARKFWVHGYTSSHGPLLLRSYDHDGTPKRIDLVFGDTRAMELPLIGIDGGIEIELTTPDYLAGFRSNPTALIQPGLQAFAVRGLNWEGYVLAGTLWSHESDGEAFGKSSLIGMPPGWHLNQITLPSLNVARGRDFYMKLGFQLIVDSSPNYVRLAARGNGATLSLHKVAEMPTGDTAVIYLESDILDIDVENLRTEFGISVHQPPRDETWLWREARLRDPDGNVICLYHAGENRLNPPWRVKS